MSCSIAISDHEDDIWLCKNIIFRRYSDLVAERVTADEKVVHQIRMAEATNGVSLDLLHRQDPELCLRVKEAYRTVALDIVNGTLTFDEIVPLADGVSLFRDLAALLNRFQPPN